MKSGTTRETTITLDAETVDAASDLGLDISAVAQAAIQEVVAEARRKKWLADNVDENGGAKVCHGSGGMSPLRAA